MSGRSRLDDLVADYAVPEATEVVAEAPVTEAVDMVLSDDDEDEEKGTMVHAYERGRGKEGGRKCFEVLSSMQSVTIVFCSHIPSDSAPDLHALRRATPTESDITIAKVMDAVKQKFESGVEVTEMVNNIIMPRLGLS